MSERVVWMNGKLVPESQANISIYDSALMFGDMVFEMTRSFNKNHFKMPEHIDRLLDSIKFTKIPFEMTSQELMECIDEVTQANEEVFEKDDEHRILINVSRGLLSIYQRIDGIHKGTNLIIADFPLRWTVHGMSSMFETGIDLCVSAQRTIPSYLLEARVKNRSRMHYLMANLEVSSKSPGSWALLLDPNGNVAEGTGYNFFMINKHCEVITPKPINILKGISRDFVILLSKTIGYKVIEKDITYFDIINASECFVTATPFCIMPVTSIDHNKISDGKVGLITKILLNRWSNQVEVDIVDQIKKWDEKYKEEKVEGINPYSSEVK